MLIQYIDDLFICSFIQELAQHADMQTLNFPAEQGYKVSRPKAELVSQWVQYLGLILAPREQRLSVDRV